MLAALAPGGPGLPGQGKKPVPAKPEPRDLKVFTVELNSEADDLWQVWLPHQCGYWGVVGCNTDNQYGDEFALPHDQAVTEMELFIQRAQDALERLRQREEDGEEGRIW